MNKLIFILLLIFLVSCQSQTNEQSETKLSIVESNTLALPINFNCDTFLLNPEKTWTIDTKSQFQIQLKGQSINHSAVLSTIDKNGKTIDTLSLFDTFCFFGVDSHYMPTLTISNEMEIIWTDSIFSSEILIDDNPTTKNTFELKTTIDTLITVVKYQINENGKIKKITEPNRMYRILGGSEV